MKLVSLVFPFALVVGSFILCIVVFLLYLGIKTPDGKLVSWGLGTYYDRTGIIARAIIILFIGVMAFTIGLLV